MVAACLTLIRHWINEGCPEWRGKPLPSFEEWSRVMGGLLQTIGVDGFLQNLDMTADASSSDEGDWPDFIGGWFDTFGSKPRLSGNPFVSNALGKEAGEFDGSASSSASSKRTAGLSRSRGNPFPEEGVPRHFAGI
ncbi:hypothetical protein [Methylocystis sp. S23]